MTGGGKGGAEVTGMVFLSCMVPEDLKARLAALGDLDDRKLSYMVRQAIGEYVERHEGELESNGGAA